MQNVKYSLHFDRYYLKLDINTGYFSAITQAYFPDVERLTLQNMAGIRRHVTAALNE